MFLGTTFIGGINAALPTPIGETDMDKVELNHGKYSYLYITKNILETPSESMVFKWDWNTIMYADFSNETTNAGNIDWTVETVSDIVVKRRIVGTFDWTNIAVYKIETEEDFNFVGIDRYNQSETEYEYAIVPYLQDDPGVFVIKEVESKFDDVFIIGAEETYKTVSSSGNIDTTRNISGNYNALLKSKYPVFFHSGDMNFDSGSADGKFLSLIDDCYITTKDPSYEYKRRVMDFLTDGKPKILKNSDGRIWLIEVLPNPTDSADVAYNIRNIAFQWVEVGDYRSIEDLYYSGLIDLEQKWW